MVKSSADPTQQMRRKMLELPPDWWQSVRATHALLEWFKLHIVGLLVAGSSPSGFQYSFYTGFLLSYAQKLLWLTAGHVVEELQLVLSSPHFRVSQFRWLDSYDAAGASAVPVHRADMPIRSWNESGLDVGVIVPSILDAGNLRKNEKLQLMDERVWGSLKQTTPEGYYAIGYPRPWTTHTQRRVSQTKVLHSLKADLACLPMILVQAPKTALDDDRWADTEAFFGRILRYPDLPQFEVDDIKGMSGGPVLSVERSPDGEIIYRLAGIIQSWRRSESIVRAEPIAKVVQALTEWLT